MSHPFRAPALAPIALAVLAIGLAGATHAEGLSRGHVYTSSNDPAGNALVVFRQAPGGTLVPLGNVATGGTGTGAGLGSQGAVTLSQDGRYAFVVNAGSRSVSTFALSDEAPRLVSTVDAGGDTPVSVTESRGLVYVLDAGGAGQVAGFRNDGGTLTALADGVRPLSGAGVSPAQVSFDRTGRTLVVTEKASGLITSWSVRVDGSLGSATETTSAGATPFGFSFDVANHLLVSEAQGGAAGVSSLSSYRLAGGVPQVVTPALSTTQTAACWTVASPDGRWVWTANAASDDLSRFAIGRRGGVQLAEAVTAYSPGSHPLDLAISTTGARLYALDGGLHQVATYAVGEQGALSARSAVAVPATAAGLAAD